MTNLRREYKEKYLSLLEQKYPAAIRILSKRKKEWGIEEILDYLYDAYPSFRPYLGYIVEDVFGKKTQEIVEGDFLWLKEILS